MKSYTILLFYKYVHIDDTQAVREWLFSSAKALSLTGRFIVASEGINITLEGTTEETEAFIKILETDKRFLHIHYKRSPGTGDAFPRLSVKVRNEIVAAHLGACDIDPNELTGTPLLPEMLHAWIAEGKEFYIVDMRNAYEHAVGRFAGSICPPMQNFRDLPNIVHTIEHLKNKTVVTVCTGGVRCEKASGYLRSQGFTDVYQLAGGIVSYMEKYPNEDFQGKLYVFDGRVVMGFYTDDPKHVVIGKCASCGASSENIVDCREGGCNGQFVLCEKCENIQLKKCGYSYCPSGCNSQKQSRFSWLRERFRAILNSMRNNILKRGFTLIELLVVIAVIGILAAIVLAALSTSRAKSKDAAVQQALVNARTQAALYAAGNGNSYASACATGQIASDGVTSSPRAQIDDAVTKSGITTALIAGNAIAQTSGRAVCHATNSGGINAWVASVPLVTDSSKYYCVDSAGVGKIVTGLVSGSISGSIFTCPAS